MGKGAVFTVGIAFGLAVLGTAGTSGGRVSATVVPPSCDGETATLFLNSPGTINGTSGRDVIVGSSGKDTIRGNGGNDLICAGDGDDVVYGGVGNDLIYAEGGHDTVYGDAGNDSIYGDPIPSANFGDDKLYGGDGDDLIEDVYGGGNVMDGGPGNDTVGYVGTARGGAGNDSVSSSAAVSHKTGRVHDGLADGGAGNDFARIDGEGIANGGAGNDEVYSPTDGSTLQGGSGNDHLYSIGGEQQHYHGGSGKDTCDRSGNDRVRNCEVVNG